MTLSRYARRAAVAVPVVACVGILGLAPAAEANRPHLTGGQCLASAFAEWYYYGNDNAACSRQADGSYTLYFQ